MPIISGIIKQWKQNVCCLVCMFSLHFPGSKFLINLRRQFRVRKIFHTQVFAGFVVF